MSHWENLGGEQDFPLNNQKFIHTRQLSIQLNALNK